MNYKKNIIDLIKDSHKFQYYEIGENNNDKNRPKYFFTKYQWIIIIIVIIFLFYPSSGFPENFSGYVISGLSIFVGLLFTFLLTLYSKFKEINFDEIIKSNDRLLKNRMLVLKNYLKKISVLSLYTILLSVICIILLSFSLIIIQLNLYIDIREMTTDFKNIDILLSLKSIIILIYRGTSCYFIFNFVLNTIYLVGSFYDFIISEFDQVKLKNK